MTNGQVNSDFRILLLERALLDATARIDELSLSLAELKRVGSAGEPAIPEPIVVDADSVSPLFAGFYAREQSGTGKSYRWTGSSDAFEFRLTADRNFEWQFAMKVNAFDRAHINLLRAYVDYAQIPIGISADGGLVTGKIPKRIFGAAATLTFYLNHKFVPKQLDPSSADNRTLSLQFFELRLDPVVSGPVVAAANEQMQPVNPPPHNSESPARTNGAIPIAQARSKTANNPG